MVTASRKRRTLQAGEKKQPATHAVLRFDRRVPALDGGLRTRGEASCVNLRARLEQVGAFARFPHSDESPEATWEKIKRNITC